MLINRLNGLGGRALGREAPQKGFACGEVRERDVFVRLVSLVDGAGAAHDGRDAGGLKPSRFGRERYRDGGVAAGEASATGRARTTVQPAQRSPSTSSTATTPR